MNSYFRCIGITGHSSYLNTLTIYKTLYYWLLNIGYEVIIEKDTAQRFQLKKMKTCLLTEIGQQADLVIVIGGDGNMLGTARVLAHYDTKIIGINRGSLGFLADLDPNHIQQQLINVLKGNYVSEKRFLLEALINKKNRLKHISTAINEIIIHSRNVAHMIEFEVYIDEIFAFSQRSDGLIISTPTGSTAYSLSAGGPILTPSIDGIILIPMFPHTLSSRPLIINSNSNIRLKFLCSYHNLELSCDSQVRIPLHASEDVLIRRYNYYLNLIHPKNYNYFNTLSSKLGWLRKYSN